MALCSSRIVAAAARQIPRTATKVRIPRNCLLRKTMVLELYLQRNRVSTIVVGAAAKCVKVLFIISQAKWLDVTLSPS